ncbi:MAG: hypothetical protein LCH56_08550 [Proteobacteria bacterium]|nr:hypothetical protein [Pseudomonadota bacterium]
MEEKRAHQQAGWRVVFTVIVVVALIAANVFVISWLSTGVTGKPALSILLFVLAELVVGILLLFGGFVYSVPNKDPKAVRDALWGLLFLPFR